MNVRQQTGAERIEMIERQIATATTDRESAHGPEKAALTRKIAQLEAILPEAREQASIERTLLAAAETQEDPEIAAAMKRLATGSPRAIELPDAWKPKPVAKAKGTPKRSGISRNKLVSRYARLWGEVTQARTILATADVKYPLTIDPVSQISPGKYKSREEVAKSVAFREPRLQGVREKLEKLGVQFNDDGTVKTPAPAQQTEEPQRTPHSAEQKQPEETPADPKPAAAKKAQQAA